MCPCCWAAVQLYTCTYTNSPNDMQGLSSATRHICIAADNKQINPQAERMNS